MSQGRAYIFISDQNTYVKPDQSKLPSTEEQLEIFLIKYPEFDRDTLKYVVESLFGEGEKLSHVLDGGELLTLMDDIGAEGGTKEKCADFVAKLPPAQGGKATITQLACFIYNKPYQDTNDYSDPEALARINEAAAKAKEAETKLLQVRENEAKEAEEKKKMDEKIQNGLQKSGVAGKAAMFERKAQDAKSSSTNSMEKVRLESGLRKQHKEAEKELVRAKEDEAERARVIEEQAAEAKRNVKMANLAAQMDKFGIRTSKNT